MRVLFFTIYIVLAWESGLLAADVDPKALQACQSSLSMKVLIEHSFAVKSSPVLIKSSKALEQTQILQELTQGSYETGAFGVTRETPDGIELIELVLPTKSKTFVVDSLAQAAEVRLRAGVEVIIGPDFAYSLKIYRQKSKKRAKSLNGRLDYDIHFHPIDEIPTEMEDRTSHESSLLDQVSPSTADIDFYQRNRIRWAEIQTIQTEKNTTSTRALYSVHELNKLGQLLENLVFEIRYAKELNYSLVMRSWEVSKRIADNNILLPELVNFYIQPDLLKELEGTVDAESVNNIEEMTIEDRKKLLLYFLLKGVPAAFKDAAG